MHSVETAGTYPARAFGNGLRFLLNVSEIFGTLFETVSVHFRDFFSPSLQGPGGTWGYRVDRGHGGRGLFKALMSALKGTA